jgi:hypothetical protein
LSCALCPALRNVVAPEVRARADEAILRREGFVASLLNPYLVRPRSKRSGEQPYILIAVASGVRAAGVGPEGSR